ncbi:MAG: hypothetical protein DRO11_05105 [Methanobacteriota archaeon]|nr:MAG: hypothetical protein DRO11_05105 [Euryarchaeota archaeon]
MGMIGMNKNKSLKMREKLFNTRLTLYDKLFLSGLLFSFIAFTLTIYGLSHGYVETNPFIAKIATVSNHALIATFGTLWGCLLAVYLFIREKAWISIPFCSIVFAIPLFDMTNNIMVVVLR